MSENGLSCIDPRMTVLDILSRHRDTEAVFNAWDRRAGECICCRALFDTLQQVADRYGLDPDLLMEDINTAGSQADAPVADRKHALSNLPSNREKPNG